MLPLVENVDAIQTRIAATVTGRLHLVADRSVRFWRSAAGPASFLLRNLALAAGVLGLWRLGSDLGWTRDFIISAGFWSHWQTWLALAALLTASANFILRAARPAGAKSR
jgi:hypothetical protein